MPSNISYNSVDLDTLFAPHVTNNAANLTGYRVAGIDIQSRYDVIANPALSNAGSRIPATSIRTNAAGWSNTDLASIFCGNAGQYSLTTPANGTKNSAGGWLSPKTWTHTITITFANASALTNYFFYGGRIQIAPTQGAGTLADNTLATMFSNMGALIIYDAGHYRTGIGGTISNASTGGSNIGTTPVALYNTTDGFPYSGSTYNVSMVANAPAGSATVLTVTTVLNIVTYTGVAGTDVYTGTYTSNVQQRNHPSRAVPIFNGTMASSVPAFSFNPVVTANTSNYDLRAAAVSAGWDQISALNTTVTVNAGIIISSNNTSVPAFKISGAYPAGSVINVNNSGYIIGMGGAGGNGQQQVWTPTSSKSGYWTITGNATAGFAGGPAITVSPTVPGNVVVNINNSGGVIGGGGGGGGGAVSAIQATSPGGGGGRTGSTNSAGGGGGYGSYPGTFSSAGAGLLPGGHGNSGPGGNWGAGGDVGWAWPGDYVVTGGGSGGNATIGNAYITWIAVGTRYGALG